MFPLFWEREIQTTKTAAPLIASCFDADERNTQAFISLRVYACRITFASTSLVA